MDAYEQAREAQKAKNKLLLHSFGLPTITDSVLAVEIPSKPVKPPVPKKKRVSVTPAAESSSGVVLGDANSTSGRRSSGRVQRMIENREKKALEVQKDLQELESDYESDGEGGKRQRAAPRDIPVGKTWEFRMAASQDGIHAPVVAGIAGSEEGGAWSVALSGGYEDDLDLGYAFTFTGSGGRDLKGTRANPKNLRTAPQTSDQEFTKVNAALQKSVETQNPVRVIRGFKGKSCFAPETGYRYDGLYRVTKAWRDVGEAGFLVCRYAFVRLDGQPDIPIQADRQAEGDEIIKQFKEGAAAEPTA